MSDKRRNKKRGITRRDFIKWSAAAGAAAKAVDWARVGPGAAGTVKQTSHTFRNICPYCSVSCGVKVGVHDPDDVAGALSPSTFDGDEEIVDIYGDVDNKISEGKLCSKGSALYQLADSNRAIGARVLEPRLKIGDATGGIWYKNSISPKQGWLDIFGLSSWTSNNYINEINMSNWVKVDDPASSGASITGIKTLPKQMRDSRGAGFHSSTNDVTPSKVAFWGSSHLTNEECYLYRKLLTLYGTNNIEHQARI